MSRPGNRVTERGILFSSPMVRAILANRKDVTRRIVNPQPTRAPNGELSWRIAAKARSMVTLAEMPTFSPFGIPNDKLWVRENWKTWEQPDGTDGILFAADGAFVRIANTAAAADAWCVAHNNNSWGDTWRSSIHLPRWAARLVLEVVGVRVEPLHAIDDADAVREGVSSGHIPADEYGPQRIGYMLGLDDKTSTLYVTERDAFIAGWDKINGDRAPWAANPYVWRIEFRRCA